MELDRFSLGSPVHLLTLGIILLLSVALALFGRRAQTRRPEIARRWRTVIVVGSLLSWVVTVLYGLHPDRFRWDVSLPLQYCNLANLIAAHALARRDRRSQSLLYFWGFTLCVWAFLTPSLVHGPGHLWFWIFWAYHLFIPVSLAWILVVDGFRPRWPDLRFSLVVTIAFTLLLAALGAVTGWNYGYVGPGKPEQPSLVDVLGPYPIRILWMLLIGSAIFFLLLLPWRMRSAKDRGSAAS